MPSPFFFPAEGEDYDRVYEVRRREEVTVNKPNLRLWAFTGIWELRFIGGSIAARRGLSTAL